MKRSGSAGRSVKVTLFLLHKPQKQKNTVVWPKGVEKHLRNGDWRCTVSEDGYHIEMTSEEI